MFNGDRSPFRLRCVRHCVGMGEDLAVRLRAAAPSVDMDELLDLGCALADSDRHDAHRVD